MPVKHARNIALNGPLADWIAGQVASGAYASTGDVIHSALRLLRAQGVGDEEAIPTAAGQPARRHGHV